MPLQGYGHDGGQAGPPDFTQAPLPLAMPAEPDPLGLLSQRRLAFAEVCQHYSAQQIGAFEAYRDAQSRAWRNYEQAMTQAETSYNSTMAAAGREYDRIMTRLA